MTKRILLAFTIGVVVTFILLGLAFAAGNGGLDPLARVLFWQNTLLQPLVPAPDIGTIAHPIHEGTPINFAVFLVSIPLGFFIYGAIAYTVISRLRRQRATHP